jgi:hypothetical protein
MSGVIPGPGQFVRQGRRKYNAPLDLDVETATVCASGGVWE